MSKTPEIRFSSPENPESWTPNAASHGGNIIACLTDADAKSAEGIFNELLERIRNYDKVIQAVATALGGVCCGGVDVEGPGSTKEVLVSAIENLKSDLKLCGIRRGNDIAEFNERLLSKETKP